MRLDDPRWDDLTGGYRALSDPRPLLQALAAQPTDEKVWNALWEELHHQGNVGSASYAAVEHIAKAVAGLSPAPTHAYALVASIEIGRQNPYRREPLFTPNPPLPEWLAESYFEALARMAEWATCDFKAASDSILKRSILALLAATSGFPVLAEFCFSDEEELYERASR